MLERVLGPAYGDGDANIARDQGKHMRSTLHEFLDVGDAVQRFLNDALVLRRKTRLSGKLLNVIAICFGTRHPARGGVRLLQVASLGQISHHVANASRTQTFTIGARQGARAYRVSGGDKGLHNGGQDLSLPLPNRLARWHIKYL